MSKAIESTLENRKKQKTSVFHSSSAVFLVAKNEGLDLSTEISFLNHFLLKRGIDNVVAKIYIRSLGGDLVREHVLTIAEPRVYAFDPCADIPSPFLGSAYIHFQSDQNLAVPFCAVVSTIRAKDSVCAVHTYGRQLESKEIGSKIDLESTTESGWTVRDDAGVQSFGVFHNGASEVKLQVAIDVSNHAQESLNSTRFVSIAKHGTLLIVPSNQIPDLAKFLGGRPGHAKVGLKGLKGSFPRMLCGNFFADDTTASSPIQASEIQFTHTNFDFGDMKQPDSVGRKGFFNHPYLPDGYGFYYPVSTEKDIDVCGQKFVSNQFNAIPVTSFDQAEIVSIGENLPSRLVGASIGHWNKTLPSECSTGTFVEDYNMVPCHWHWGLLKPSKEFGKCVISIFANRFDGSPNLARTLKLRVFDIKGLVHEDDFEFNDHQIIDVDDFIPEGTTDDCLWYAFSGDKLEDLNVFSTFLPPDKSGFCEHAF